MIAGVNINKIIEIIDEDIKYQMTKIIKEEKESSLNFEKNKPFRWRIIGMEHIKKEIIDSFNRGDLR